MNNGIGTEKANPYAPFCFVIPGHVPALKNNKDLAEQGNRTILIANAAVERFYKKNEGILNIQRERQKHMAKIAMPSVAFLHVTLFYLAVTVPFPRADGDNGFTTIQELCQSPNQPHGILDIVDDDKQILHGCFEVKRVKDRHFEGAIFYLWEDDGQDAAIQFYDNYHFVRSRAAEQVIGETAPDDGLVDDLDIRE